MGRVSHVPPRTPTRYPELMSDELLVAVMGTGIVAADDPVLTADDLGLTRGDGVFDATRVVTGEDGTSHIDNLSAHLSRFARSIAGVNGAAPDLEAWTALINELVTAWRRPGEAVLKVMYTNGPETRRVHSATGEQTSNFTGRTGAAQNQRDAGTARNDAQNPPGETGDHPNGAVAQTGPVTQLATIAPLPAHTIAERTGISVITACRGFTSDAFAGAPWLLGGVKTLSYAVNVAACRHAAAHGADDVIFTSSDGFLLEGPTSGLLVEKDGRLWTTPTGATGILRSITVEQVLEAADARDIPTSSRLMRPEELLESQGVWLASSGRGVVPVLRVDGHELATDEQLTEQMRLWCGFTETPAKSD